MSQNKSPLSEISEFSEVKEKLKRKVGPLLITGCIDSSKAYIAKELSDAKVNLFITYNETRAAEIADDASSFDLNSEVYPSKDLLFYQADVQGDLLTKRRMAVLKKIFLGEELFIAVSVESLLEKIPPLSQFKDKVLHIGQGETYNISDLERKLSSMGYERYPQVDAAGQFAVRGGIVDVYPIAMEDPVRIEFFDDEVDTIKTFDVESQRSFDAIDVITIFPGKEPESEDVMPVSLLDYMPVGTNIFLDEPSRLREKADGVFKEFSESMNHRSSAGFADSKDAPELFVVDYVFDSFIKPGVVMLTGLDTKCAGIKPAHSTMIQTQGVTSYLGQTEELVRDLEKWKKEKATVIFYAGSKTRAKRLEEEFTEKGLSAFCSEKTDEAQRGSIQIVSGNLKKGFAFPMIRFYVLSYGDLYGRRKMKKRRASKFQGMKMSELSSLKIGDFVIHEKYGIGIYQGTELINRHGITNDYMRISYSDGALLFPITQMNQVQKYADKAVDKAPRLNRLSGGEWKRTKSRVKKAVKEIAIELVELYAARLKGDGYQFSKDTMWQQEFEEQFVFEETDDQLRAIEDTKADMESTKIMDRLICGDVGFGKTEIAIRAAFKAVQDGKQVAYICPTTILSQQHYNTFTQRLAEYGLSIELLCRFKTPTEQKKIVSRIAKGQVDIVIGTHRILSNDVKFKDLGLLVVDEEQRFGVGHKEKIKSLKETVDVISLTATPIPRTLHMSLIGARDMSLLREAPLDRMPIQTYVMEHNDEIIREAIAREIARGGQVYYVYNKTRTIADKAARISELVPEASVAFAHGKMRQNELEPIMLDFINGEIDVLVSTTIVETGLDISNVNTIIIHDADKFGLAQLYQLRGRVGRSNRTAYAFLLYKKDKELSENAEERLSAIREYTELGSGFKIAMRDLELRGSGDILGAEQHGHMESVGYDLYCKMLGEAIKEEKNELKITEEFDTEIELDIDAFIPDDYITYENQRISLYRRIACIENEEERMDVIDELIDRFGDVPVPVQNLANIALLKQVAHDNYITKISGDKSEFKIDFYATAPINGEKVPELLKRYRGDLRVIAANGVSFTYNDNRHNCPNEQMLIFKINEIIAEIGKLMV